MISKTDVCSFSSASLISQNSRDSVDAHWRLDLLVPTGTEIAPYLILRMALEQQRIHHFQLIDVTVLLKLSTDFGPQCRRWHP